MSEEGVVYGESYCSTGFCTCIDIGSVALSAVQLDPEAEFYIKSTGFIKGIYAIQF